MCQFRFSNVFTLTILKEKRGIEKEYKMAAGSKDPFYSTHTHETPSRHSKLSRSKHQRMSSMNHHHPTCPVCIALWHFWRDGLSRTVYTAKSKSKTGSKGFVSVAKNVWTTRWQNFWCHLWRSFKDWMDILSDSECRAELDSQVRAALI